MRRAPGPAIATDEANRVVVSNLAARELLGLESEREAEGRNIHELLRTRDIFGNPLASPAPRPGKGTRAAGPVECPT